MTGDHGREMRTRAVGFVETIMGDGEEYVVVDHVYTTDVCEHGNQDDGMVGLCVAVEGNEVMIALTEQEAPLVANRLTRAANLVLESGEDVADVEREYRRHNPEKKL